MTSAAFFLVQQKKYVERFNKIKFIVFPSLNGRVPVETTCAWTEGETNNEYAINQKFAHVTAGIALDTLVFVFEHLDTVGSIFWLL